MFAMKFVKKLKDKAEKSVATGMTKSRRIAHIKKQKEKQQLEKETMVPMYSGKDHCHHSEQEEVKKLDTEE